MDSNNNDDHRRELAGLGSLEYRTKLLTKLNCLIAVLEVAIAKITRNLKAPGAEEQRLEKIRGNLANTLAICSRAKKTLERAMIGSSESSTTTAADVEVRRREKRGKMSYRDYVELSSIEEYQKFKNLPPISWSELDKINLEDLIERFNED